jgi:transketolase
MDLLEKLQKRIFDISYKNKLGHISTNLDTLNVLIEIYNSKKKDDVFILSNGHAGLALYVVLEYYNRNIDAEELLKKHGIHPSLDFENKIYCSTGSLGMGVSVALGYALGDRTRNVYCTISDGECDEGVVWECFRLKHLYKLDNLKIHVIANGLSAYKGVDTEYLAKTVNTFCDDIVIHKTVCNFSFLHGIQGHYHVLTEKEYLEAIKTLGVVK